jgi:hypothetical protein
MPTLAIRYWESADLLPFEDRLLSNWEDASMENTIYLPSARAAVVYEQLFWQLMTCLREQHEFRLLETRTLEEERMRQEEIIRTENREKSLKSRMAFLERQGREKLELLVQREASAA